jgi:hypothetical protein
MTAAVADELSANRLFWFSGELFDSFYGSDHPTNAG